MMNKHQSSTLEIRAVAVIIGTILALSVVVVVTAKPVYAQATHECLTIPEEHTTQCTTTNENNVNVNTHTTDSTPGKQSSGNKGSICAETQNAEFSCGSTATTVTPSGNLNSHIQLDRDCHDFTCLKNLPRSPPNND